MSEEQVQAKAGAPDQAKAVGTDVSEEVVSETAAEVNARLLNESRQNKDRARKAEKELDELKKFKASVQQEKMEYKPLWEEATKKLSDLEERVKKTTIIAAVKEVGQKLGCVDTDLLLAAGPQGVLDWDSEGLTPVGVQEFVEAAKKAKPFLFATTKTPTINPTTPGGVVKGMESKKIADLSRDEILAKLKSLPRE